jgi:hypothetical protein
VQILKSLEHFKAAYDNKAFTLSHCWSILKDSKKWEDSFLPFGKSWTTRRAEATAMPRRAMSSTLMARGQPARACQVVFGSASL